MFLALVLERQRHQRPKAPKPLMTSYLVCVKAGRKKYEVRLEPVESSHHPRRGSVETSGVHLSPNHATQQAIEKKWLIRGAEGGRAGLESR